MTRDPDWLGRGLKHIWLPYTQMKTEPAPLPVVAAEGCRLQLADGRELIDSMASWWTAAHGYRHPHLIEAIEGQTRRLAHVMLGGLVQEPALVLAARLADRLPGDLNRVFFSESGSVAVEVAMKIALQYWLNKGQRGRTRFVSFLGGYHGDTFAAMSVCDPDEGMHTLFKGALAPQHVVPLPHTEEELGRFRDFLNSHAHEVAAVVLEPLVQGAGGMRMHTPQALAAIAQVCRAADVLLILDEIFTGFARTGSMFASLQAGVVPDIITLGKALTGGTVPLAATVASTKVFEAFWSDDVNAALMHGPTFSGNAIACAAANASLDLFDREPRLAQAMAIESQLRRALEPARALPGVADVRVMGAIGVIEFDHAPDLAGLRAAMVARGVWNKPFGRILYTTPPLVMSEDELSQVTDAMVAVARDWCLNRRAKK